MSMSAWNVVFGGDGRRSSEWVSEIGFETRLGEGEMVSIVKVSQVALPDWS